MRLFIAPIKCNWIKPRLHQTQLLYHPIVLCFLLLSFKFKARTKDTVVAPVHASAFACVHCAWVEAAWRRRCCREQKRFTDVAGKEDWMESSVVISRRAALSYSKRYATCGLVPTLCCSFRFADRVKIEKFDGTKWQWGTKSAQKDQKGGRERGKEKKNMFTSGGWGWRRLRFPSWSDSQCGGGWDSLLVPLDETWGKHIALRLCLSLSLTFSCLCSNCPSMLLATSQPCEFLILLSISITCHMYSVIALPHDSPRSITLLLFCGRSQHSY